MKRAVFVAFFCLGVNLSSAQDSWVCTIDNDTIYGKVGFIIKSPYDADEVIVKADKKKQKYIPTQVKRVNKKGMEYVPLKINSKYQFAQVMKEGYLSWYKYINPDSNAFEDFSMTILTKLDGTSVQLSNLGFMRSVGIYLEDCDPLENRLKNREFKPADLGEIVDLYNEWINLKSDSNQIIEQDIDIEKNSVIISLLSNIESDKELSKNEELMDMLKDVKGKLSEGKPIPEYLKNGVLENLNGRDELIQEFNSIF